ncbi:hypothetical protein CPS_3012 [Colwellia psychrerythraea 34H]|uniref:Uncharacterized protein n=1 Tax=Colwellia psychrerythraea (strain 34H / ATCC BAA-681) TaxID=167879 RepID=Q47ZQ8_COLP3|nr:hypothetical protein CPS_3012 [Colwellia psychrerythraea 34H]
MFIYLFVAEYILHCQLYKLKDKIKYNLKVFIIPFTNQDVGSRVLELFQFMAL